MTLSTATVYTAGDCGYFPGVAALVNSLAVVGFSGKVVVLDLGLSDVQRMRLERVTQVVSAPSAGERDDRLAVSISAKSYLAQLSLSGLIVWIDSDIIITSALNDVVRQAAAGKICVIRDDWPEEAQRGFTEWNELFALRQPVQLRTYVNAGFFAFSTEAWPELLSLFAEACTRIQHDRILVNPPETNPFWAGDQDAFNAVLMSEVPADAVFHLHPSEMVGSRRMPNASIGDARRLNVTCDGRRVRILHAAWAPKPWTASAWARAAPNLYLQLLPRLFFAADVPLRLERSDVAPWLWPGFAGVAVRRVGVGLGVLRTTVGRAARKLPSGMRSRVFALRNRLDRWLGSR